MVALPAVVDGVPLGSDGKPLRPHFEWDESERCPIGRDPRRMSIAELHAIGVYARPVLKAIRANCIDCMGGNTAEVRRCGQVACQMWAFRMGTNPFRSRDLTDERRDELRERGNRLAAASRVVKLTGQTPDGFSPVSDSPEDPEDPEAAYVGTRS